MGFDLNKNSEPGIEQRDVHSNKAITYSKVLFCKAQIPYLETRV